MNIKEMRQNVISEILSVKGNKKGVKITANGVVTALDPKNGTDYQLKEMQDVVGGYIEVVHVRLNNKTYLLVCDEDGWMHQREPNLKATMLWGDTMVGDILLCDDDAIE